MLARARSRRHIIFAVAIALYATGVVGAVATRFPSMIAGTTFLIAVAAWGYGSRVAVPVMFLAIAVCAAAVTRIAGPAGLVTLTPMGVIVPIAMMECLLVVGLSSLRRLELLQMVAEAELRLKNDQLQAALDEVRELRGLLPICAWCKSIRDVDGMWSHLESYLARNSRAKLTHGMCPNCLTRQVGQLQMGAVADDRCSMISPRTNSS